MVGTCLLLGLLAVATATDLRWGKIYNWTTYSGLLLAVAAGGAVTGWAAYTTAEEEALGDFWGIAPLGDSLLGLFACGMILLVCYVSFPGGVGGGDIKLM